MQALFNILALIYVLRSVQLAVVIVREWSDINQEPLTRHKKHLAEQAAFFIAVPIGVFIHELGHAVAVWLSGGQVVEFGYRVFWGYVLPAGEFTASQSWFIAIAGTWGSLLFGLGTWLLLRNHSVSSLRYFGLRAFRFQVYFSLIYYPLFTLFGFVGDWRTIYAFGATPILSGVTVVFHAGLLGLFWYGDRVGWFERPSYETPAEQMRFEQLARETAVHPHDPQIELEYIDALRRGGAPRSAQRRLAGFLEKHPNAGAGYLQLALTQTEDARHIPSKAVKNLETALSLGLPNDRATALTHRLLGQYYLETGKTEQALTSLGQAIALSKKNGRDANLGRLYHMRSQALRQLRRYSEAEQDLSEAIHLMREAGDEKDAAAYEDERRSVAQQAGQSVS